MWRPSTIAGVGSLAFSVLSFTAVTLVNSPGGGYAESTVTDYLAASHFPIVLLGLCLGLLGVVGLLCLLSYLRELMGTGADGQQLGSVFWGTGVASAACFAVGWGFVAGQPVARAEAGSVLAATTCNMGIGAKTMPGAASIAVSARTAVLRRAHQCCRRHRPKAPITPISARTMLA